MRWPLALLLGRSPLASCPGPPPPARPTPLAPAQVIAADLERKQADLLRAYAADIKEVADIFASNRDGPVLSKNSAPHSGGHEQQGREQPDYRMAGSRPWDGAACALALLAVATAVVASLGEASCCHPSQPLALPMLRRRGGVGARPAGAHRRAHGQAAADAQLRPGHRAGRLAGARRPQLLQAALAP